MGLTNGVSATTAATVLAEPDFRQVLRCGLKLTTPLLIHVGIIM